MSTRAERDRRYNMSAKGRARHARYEASRIQVSIGGIRFNYRVRPERKQELLRQIDEFRARQAVKYKGWNGRAVTETLPMAAVPLGYQMSINFLTAGTTGPTLGPVRTVNGRAPLERPRPGHRR